MGYYTTHQFNIQQEKPIYDKKVLLDLFRENCKNAFEAIDEDGDPCEVKWYESEEDLKNFSKNFPNVVLILDCEGEDGELWRIYAQNGKSYFVRPKIMYPPFNKDLFK